MWLPSAGILAEVERGTPRAQSLFIGQLWHELLSSQSPDSFRARLLDVRLLVEELARVIELAASESKWSSHVTAICDEIRSGLPPIEQMHLLPAVAQAALRSICDFRSHPYDLRRMREHCRLYLDLTESEVTQLLGAAEAEALNFRKKSGLVNALARLATHMQSRGLAEDSIALVDDSLCDLAPDQAIQRLASSFEATREYSCYVALRGTRATASSVFSIDEFPEYGAADFVNSATSSAWYEEEHPTFTTGVTLETTSGRRAAEEALACVVTLINLHALYANGSQLEASPRVLVVQGGGAPQVIEVTPSRHFGLAPRRQSATLARSRFKRLKGRLSGRLSNLLESHALGVAATDARTAVIHLWSALETLTSRTDATGIGERVANAVCPIVAWRRTDKIVTYLAISTVRLCRHIEQDFDRTHLPASRANHLDRVDMLAALSGVRNNTAILSLFESCKASPLLCYRLYKAWQGLSDARELLRALELSKNRIRWQILRLYRARNLLVHYGQIDELALRLLENAQYYLSTCVSRVLSDLSAHQEWSIETSLEYQRQRFEGLCEMLRSHPQDATMSDVLLVTDNGNSSTKLWGDGSRFSTPN